MQKRTAANIRCIVWTVNVSYVAGLGAPYGSEAFKNLGLYRNGIADPSGRAV